MTEYVIDKDEYRAAMRKAYEAGASGREVYTARDYLTRELVRCKDCKHYYEHSEEDMVYCINRSIFSWAKSKYAETEPDGYCAWRRAAMRRCTRAPTACLPDGAAANR